LKLEFLSISFPIETKNRKTEGFYVRVGSGAESQTTPPTDALLPFHHRGWYRCSHFSLLLAAKFHTGRRRYSGG
jgi:hypothetical protein